MHRVSPTVLTAAFPLLIGPLTHFVLSVMKPSDIYCNNLTTGSLKFHITFTKNILKLKSLDSKGKNKILKCFIPVS